MQKHRKLRNISIHLVVWAVATLFPAYLLYISYGPGRGFMINILLHMVLYAALFYLNYLVYARWFFQRRTRWCYLVASVVTLLIAAVFFREGMEMMMHPEGERNRIWSEAPFTEGPYAAPGRPPLMRDLFRSKPKPPKALGDYNFVLAGLMVSLLGLGLRYTRKIRQEEQKRKDAEKELIRSELLYLRNQVSPHFFFNTLNSIYALTETRPDDARETILMLSKMMRYLLYETDRPYVQLSDEIDFLNQYIQLMRLRIPQKVKVNWSFPDETTHIAVPPLLFLPFVENAFKHGISNRRPSFVETLLVINQKQLRFSCRNSVHPGEPAPEDGAQRKGIGLENVRKRLQLELPGRFMLSAGPENGIWNVTLMLDLSEYHPI
ncbi:MAG TPA: histidine kinase [Bacteroidales bacterium]|nr:histidine kinase [Bacteroidales bacterium]HRZ49285.1 histidine kinase [Bacteroidales bacterium]